MINDKITANLVKLKIVKSSNMSSNEILRQPIDNSCHYIASIICPLCSITISVSHTFEQDSVDPVWNMLNFDEHVKIHQNRVNFEVDKRSCEYFILDFIIYVETKMTWCRADVIRNPEK